jgi:Exoribonuclease R
VTNCIALVADEVGIGSDPDVDALATGFTRYNATSAVRTMLPRDLSEATLSLLPGMERQVLAFDIVLDRDLSILSTEILRARLNHRGRLSHQAAGELIETGQGDVGRMMRHAWSLSSALLDSRRKAGAIAYFSSGTGLMTDEEGHLVELGTSEAASRAYVVVQEMMILANRAVAERLAADGVHLLFRNHRGNPVADRTSLSSDLELATQGGPFRSSAEKRLEMMIGRATLGSTAKGHFGLNLPVYARMTSPIRRYEDLVNQRILLSFIAGKPSPYAPEELEVIGGSLDALAKKEADERGARFKEASERRAERFQAGDRFRHLDQTEMTAVIKSAVGSGRYSEALVSEIGSRLSVGTLTHKDIARLLLAEGASAETVRQIVMRHLEDEPASAVSVLNYLSQSGWISDLGWNDGEDPEGFRSDAGGRLGGKIFTFSHPAGSKKIARQRASVGLLAGLAGLDWRPPEAWRSGVATTVATSSAQVGNPNAKGELISFCQSRGLPMPFFDAEQSGPPHAPTFSATASVVSGGSTVRTAPVTAASKKEAERLASLALLSLLSAGGSSTAPPDRAGIRNGAGGGNPKSALQEICQKRGWPLPRYEIEQSGPSHAPSFSAWVHVAAAGRSIVSGTSTAGTRKEAEMSAAASAMDKMAATGILPADV